MMFDYSQTEEANLRLALIEANNERDEAFRERDEAVGLLRSVHAGLDRYRNAPCTDQVQQHWDGDTDRAFGASASFLSRLTPNGCPDCGNSDGDCLCSKGA